MYNNPNQPQPTWSPPPIQAPVPQHPGGRPQMNFSTNSYPNSPQPPQASRLHQQQRQPPLTQQQQQPSYAPSSSSSTAAYGTPQSFTPSPYGSQPYHRPAPHHAPTSNSSFTSSSGGPSDYNSAGAAYGSASGAGPFGGGSAGGFAPAPMGQMGQMGQMGGGQMGAQMGGIPGPQQQQQWGANIINDFQSSAAGQLGMQLGGKAFEQAQENINKNLGMWINIPHIKYYFNVSNSYVLNKIRLLLFPFRHQSWTRIVRRSEQSGQMEGYKPPREDLNAPDLYIPVMSFVTYILLVGVRLGLDDAAAAKSSADSTAKSFSPDVLGMTGTTAFFIVFFEVLFFKLGFYLLNVTTDVPFLDLVGYSGYKFLGIIAALVAKIIFPSTWAVYGVLGYAMICLGFFTLRSLKYIILPEGYNTLDPSARQRRVQFLFLVAVVQILLSSLMVFVS
ncbi:YIF1-domain-containing protein [Geranomyces variabilis]|nr:YIF1-domain-containing protein [Geranomyces variabilis]KAJ3139545.1 hypothetical protein HDU90_009046 [Geranomyces variabilis]